MQRAKSEWLERGILSRLAILAGTPWVLAAWFLLIWLGGRGPRTDTALLVASLAILGATVGGWILSRIPAVRGIVWLPGALGGLIQGVAYGAALGYQSRNPWLAVSVGLALGILGAAGLGGFWDFWVAYRHRASNS
jgi:hypothetical protein